MFDFFKKPEYTMPEIKTVETPKHNDDPVYQVGKTLDGSVTLRMGYTTLTMSEAGVDSLIRLLEAAKENNNEETV
jgi:hypothetical protein